MAYHKEEDKSPMADHKESNNNMGKSMCLIFDGPGLDEQSKGSWYIFATLMLYTCDDTMSLPELR